MLKCKTRTVCVSTYIGGSGFKLTITKKCSHEWSLSITILRLWKLMALYSQNFVMQLIAFSIVELIEFVWIDKNHRVKCMFPKLESILTPYWKKNLCISLEAYNLSWMILYNFHWQIHLICLECSSLCGQIIFCSSLFY